MKLVTSTTISILPVAIIFSTSTRQPMALKMVLRITSVPLKRDDY